MKLHIDTSAVYYELMSESQNPTDMFVAKMVENINEEEKWKHGDKGISPNLPIRRVIEICSANLPFPFDGVRGEFRRINNNFNAEFKLDLSPNSSSQKDLDILKDINVGIKTKLEEIYGDKFSPMSEYSGYVCIDKDPRVAISYYYPCASYFLGLGTRGTLKTNLNHIENFSSDVCILENALNNTINAGIETMIDLKKATNNPNLNIYLSLNK